MPLLNKSRLNWGAKNQSKVEMKMFMWCSIGRSRKLHLGPSIL